MTMTLKEKYKKLLSRTKQTVSAEDVEKVKADAESATRLLEAPEFEFFRLYLTNAQKSITEVFVQNRIKKVTESITDQTGVTKTMETTKEEQLNELSGQYNFIETLLQDLRAYADLPKELEEAKKTGSIDVSEGKEG